MLSIFQSIRKHTLFLGVVLNLLPLIYYKFSGQFSENYWYRSTDHDGLGFLDLGVPIGLSFFSLFQISALVDTYKKRVSNQSLLSHLQFSFFFPNFTSGPFLLYRDGINQLISYQDSNLKFDYSKGFSLIIIGLAKKILIADQLSIPINGLYQALNSTGALSLIEAWFIFWGFMVQLYFDFSAYSDIAIGMALCLGITLPINFNSPLKSHSLLDYIYRWHISFVNYVREYVFSPVSSLIAKRLASNYPASIRYFWAWIVASAFTYMAIGLWHAPSINTAIYTTIAVFILIFPQFLQAKYNISQLSKYKIPILLKRIALLSVICFTASIFRISDLSDIQPLLNSLVNIDSISLSKRLQPIFNELTHSFVQFNGVFPSLKLIEHKTTGLLSPSLAVIFLVFVTVIVFKGPNSMQLFNMINNDKLSSKFSFRPNFLSSLIMGVLLLVVLFVASNQVESSFIYQIF